MNYTQVPLCGYTPNHTLVPFLMVLNSLSPTELLITDVNGTQMCSSDQCTTSFQLAACSIMHKLQHFKFYRKSSTEALTLLKPPIHPISPVTVDVLPKCFTQQADEDTLYCFLHCPSSKNCYICNKMLLAGWNYLVDRRFYPWVTVNHVHTSDCSGRIPPIRQEVRFRLEYPKIVMIDVNVVINILAHEINVNPLMIKVEHSAVRRVLTINPFGTAPTPPSLNLTTTDVHLSIYTIDTIPPIPHVRITNVLHSHYTGIRMLSPESSRAVSLRCTSCMYLLSVALYVILTL
jgi:hypothetical protein